MRAVSAAYYAVFHELCETVATSFVGGPGADRSTRAWKQAYRAVDHYEAKRRCNQVSAGNGAFPAGIKDFAREFSMLQDQRHSADYDPMHRIDIGAAEAEIIRAEKAIRDFRSCPAKDRGAFAVWIVFRMR